MALASLDLCGAQVKASIPGHYLERNLLGLGSSSMSHHVVDHWLPVTWALSWGNWLKQQYLASICDLNFPQHCGWVPRSAPRENILWGRKQKMPVLLKAVLELIQHRFFHILFVNQHQEFWPLTGRVTKNLQPPLIYTKGREVLSLVSYSILGHGII